MFIDVCKIYGGVWLKMIVWVKCIFVNFGDIVMLIN